VKNTVCVNCGSSRVGSFRLDWDWGNGGDWMQVNDESCYEAEDLDSFNKNERPSIDCYVCCNCGTCFNLRSNQEPRGMMNLISKVPQTEEEVMQALQYSDSLTTNAMRGIARVRIKMGDTPEQAYEYALLQYISIMKGRGANEKD
jgi:hypothetical protein